MKEYNITKQGHTLYIKPLQHQTGTKKASLEYLTDIIAYEVKIESTIKDLHADYSNYETDSYFKMILETKNNQFDIELYYYNLDNIKRDYDIIKDYIKQYQEQNKMEDLK